ncbi:uncharacterized protein LOC112345604 [Selaginella moellendorffii]|uniref:uncharacterized protein LOC112345604 n=1 Tax=Selaginella moellendorffii TaxID=88036 RepID=UPI000D1CDB63|nr:uncharacterized protein LOC112345604 [Selaginella moellendorffii]|eukprot:XP_024528502.1 uncharacterized protein LOC112345604 [Selaginella moellendorffii]
MRNFVDFFRKNRNSVFFRLVYDCFYEKCRSLSSIEVVVSPPQNVSVFNKAILRKRIPRADVGEREAIQSWITFKATALKSGNVEVEKKSQPGNRVRNPAAQEILRKVQNLDVLELTNRLRYRTGQKVVCQIQLIQVLHAAQFSRNTTGEIVVRESQDDEAGQFHLEQRQAESLERKHPVSSSALGELDLEKFTVPQGGCYRGQTENHFPGVIATDARRNRARELVRTQVQHDQIFALRQLQRYVTFQRVVSELENYDGLQLSQGWRDFPSQSV